jgi:hypothetical protein
MGYFRGPLNASSDFISTLMLTPDRRRTRARFRALARRPARAMHFLRQGENT